MTHRTAPDEDPVLVALRKAATGDEDAKREFWALRTARAAALLTLENDGHDRARAMLRNRA